MGLMAVLGLKPGVWYHKKPKMPKAPERQKTRLNVENFGTSEEEYAKLQFDELDDLRKSQGKRKTNFTGGGRSLIGGGSGLG